MKLKQSIKVANLAVSSLDGALGENGVSLKGLPIRSNIKSGETVCNGSYTESRPDPNNPYKQQKRTCQICEVYSGGERQFSYSQCTDWPS